MGRLAAVRDIPPQPADCKITGSHVRVTASSDPWSLLMKEGSTVDALNARITRCNGEGGFYDRMRATQDAAVK